MARDNLETVPLNPADCSDTALTFKTVIKKHGRKDKNEAASILMMKPIAAISILALLAACGDSIDEAFGDFSNGDAAEDDGGLPPSDEGVDGEDTPSGEFTNTGGAGPIPAAVASDLADVTFTPGASTITVSGATLDTTPIGGVYTRNTALDINGYEAYTIQEDALDRLFIALVSRSANGAVEGGVVVDGGQFDNFFGGAFYRQNEAFAPGSAISSLASYTGSYVALNNSDARGSSVDQLLPVPGGTDPSLTPDQSERIEGNVFINADFSDNVLNGAIFDRRNVETGQSLDTINLEPTSINDNGSFSGTATALVGEDVIPRGVGTFAGTFGGANAEGVAAGTNFTNYDDDVEREEEFGSFVLSRCGTDGEGALCSNVLPE